MSYFKESTVDLGQIKAGSNNVNVKWEFEDLTLDDIAKFKDVRGVEQYAIRPGCGCTAKFSFTEKGIEAVYTDSLKKGGKTKSVTVYLKPEDGVPVRVQNNRNTERFNEALKTVVIVFKLESI